MRFIRFYVPAVILIVLAYGTAKILRIKSEDVPVNVNDLGYNLSYLIIAAFYQYLPVRDWAYRPFKNEINEHIRSRLVAISGLSDDSTKFSWKRVGNVFYALVDNDKSLEKRSEDVMFNGAMMTSFADLTAISAIFFVGNVIALHCGVGALRAVAILGGLILISIAMQFAAKMRHIRLGTYQLDYIEQHLKQQVVDKMTALNA
ncbi:hypothetical protein CAP39_13665 [Sphingomonas sp. IBVSS1]|nr:hypothetical protein CAP39_13665 [Sphingomonas sp. IBVSS1]